MALNEIQSSVSAILTAFASLRNAVQSRLQPSRGNLDGDKQQAQKSVKRLNSSLKRYVHSCS